MQETAKKKKILVVEDDRNIAALLQFNIQAEGYECDVASDGNTGLSMALSGSYDLLLLDIMLPFFNGYHWCSSIRKVSKVPIIFITSASDTLRQYW